MKKGLTIFYDMDNTIAEMHKALVNCYSKDARAYAFSRKQEQVKAVNILHTRDFFQKLTVIENSVEVIRKLIEQGIDVRILSQPMINNYCITEKNNWLDRFLPMIPKCKRVYTFDKYLLAGPNKILVDDLSHHLEAWKAHGGTGICFQRGYNRNWKGDYIVRHEQIMEKINNHWR